MIDDYRHRESRESRIRRGDGRSQHQRRAVIEKLRLAVVRIDVGSGLAELSDINHGDARRFDEESNIDPANIIAFEEVWLIATLRMRYQMMLAH